jgi:ribosomal protein S12 methylthiotransferase
MSEPRVGFVSLGCARALVDSERILGALREEGYQIASDYDAADLVIVNTCGFIHTAVEESLEAIGEALAKNGKVIVTGCLGARSRAIVDEHPDVLCVTGPQRYDEVLEAVHTHLPSTHTHNPFSDLLPPGGLKLTPRHYAYLKIAEGCDHKCSFCIVPSMRGPLLSRPVHEVLTEAQALVSAGVRELLVISQDASAYGADLKHRADLWSGRRVRTHVQDLARELGSLADWVRLHCVYPYPHIDTLIEFMADGTILPYLEVPFQHASPALLKQMRRPAHAEDTLARLESWREICPDLTLRSTFIVGFPGETEADFDTLLEFLTHAQVDHASCLTYAPVDGAAANDLPGAVAEELKRERYARFMTHQGAINAARLQKSVGLALAVIIDEIDSESGAYGRTEGDAPDVDGGVYITDGHLLTVGDIVEVTIDGADEHGLFGHAALDEFD